MTQRGGTQIPWASLAVVAAFVSSTFLVPSAFDLLRPPERDRAQAFSGAELEVDARLWEDPFTALRRHETELSERCKNPASASTTECNATQRALRRAPQALRAHLDGDADGDGDGEIDAQSTLLIAMLVPGNPFVGAEESRRRTRFALLAGLQAEGYFSDSAEQVGVMQVPLQPLLGGSALTPLASARLPTAAAVSGSTDSASTASASTATGAGDQLKIPYELLSRNRSVRGVVEAPNGDKPAAKSRRPFERVVVVWVDESALPGPKLDGVARLLDTVIACRKKNCPRLAVMGPSSSDGLNVALHGLEAAVVRRSQAPERIDAALANGYRLLADAHFYIPSATIAEEDLPLLRRYGLSLQEFLTGHFAGIVPERGRLSPAEREVKLERTIATDDVVASLLASEVLQRLPLGSPRRIVTVVESDSIYARGLERRFRQLVAHSEQVSGSDQVSRIDQSYFFRGLDGITLRDGPERPAAQGKNQNANSTVEWPEAPSQLDYLRRMAEDLKRSESSAGRGPIGAIGIFANDVHDKLLVLQALHDTFPDKVFFTTDMDARFVHPRVLPFTRNLVVASSLPLQLPPRYKTGTQELAPQQAQEGTPPMRDIYQTATYLAARLAACVRLCGAVTATTEAALASPSVYEIGRTRAIAVAGFDAAAQRQQHAKRDDGQLLALGLVCIVIAVLGWPSTPALRLARLRWSKGLAASPMTSLFTLLYGLWLGFAAASLMEASAPASLGVQGVWVWTLLGGLAAALLAPGLHGIAAALGWAPRLRLLQTLGVLLWCGLLAAAWWVVGPAQPEQGEPLLWLQGVSGWPSHFLHLLAALAAVVAMDAYWRRGSEVRSIEALWLDVREPAAAAQASAGPPERWQSKAHSWLQRHSLLAWRMPAAGKIVFADAWHRYQQLSLPMPRLVRMLFWYVVTVTGATLLFNAFTAGYIPEMPVRGATHRSLMIVGMLLALAALPALVVAVADATMATCRLMWVLGRGRTQYPSDVVKRFAREMGAEHQDMLAEPIAAEPSQRGTAEPVHSLLDDWIDIQVVARQTQAVSPLILAPFMVLALLVLARSRLFDSWALTWPIALTVAAYLLWLVGLAVALKVTAERLRSDVLSRMQADLRWLGGAGGGRDKLVEPFKRLITAVENNTTGAFAATFDQPLVTSLMVPLGGAGGVQVLDYLLLAR